MLRILCDKCRTRLAAGDSTMKVRTGPLRSSHGEVHLCQEHTEEFLGWLLEKVPKVVPPQVVKARPPAGRNVRR
jgi:hypothetical protein